MRFLLLVSILLLANAGLSAQEEALPEAKPEAQDPAALLTSLRASFGEVVALGEVASKPVKDLGRRQPVKAAEALLRAVARKLGKLEKPAPEPEAAAVEETCKTFASRLCEFVKLGDKGVEAVQSAAEKAEGFEKDFLDGLRGRLCVHVAILEIKSFFVGGRNPGTYEGMFPKTAKLGPAGGNAMLDVFTDARQSLNVRRLAAEGVAQLGRKEHIAAVKTVHGDTIEDQNLRATAMIVMARLGDRSAFDAQVAAVDRQIKEKVATRDKDMASLRKLMAEVKELKAVEAPTDEQKSRLERVQKDAKAANSKLARQFYDIGNAYQRRARMFLELRDREEAEGCYKDSLKSWLRVASRMTNASAREQMNIAFYNLACVQSLQGKVDEAIKSMDSCFEWGYRNYAWIEKDGDLAAIRKDQRFQDLIAEVKSGKAAERWKKRDEERKKARQTPDGQ